MIIFAFLIPSARMNLTVLMIPSLTIPGLVGVYSAVRRLKGCAGVLEAVRRVRIAPSKNEAKSLCASVLAGVWRSFDVRGDSLRVGCAVALLPRVFRDVTCARESLSGESFIASWPAESSLRESCLASLRVKVTGEESSFESEAASLIPECDSRVIRGDSLREIRGRSRDCV